MRTLFIPVSMIALVLAGFSSGAFAMGKKRVQAEEVKEPPSAIIVQDVKMAGIEALGSTPVSEISIATQSSSAEFEIVQSEQFGVIATIAAKSRHEIDAFKSGVIESLDSFEKRHIGISIDNGSHFYLCSMSQFNGKIFSMKGACIVKVKIMIPAELENVTVLGDGKLFQGEMSVEVLVKSISSELSSSKQADLLDRFLAQSSVAQSGVSVADTIAILRAFSFDSQRSTACNRIAGNVANVAVLEHQETANALVATFDIKPRGNECLAQLTW